jgi:hypothetical protein
MRKAIRRRFTWRSFVAALVLLSGVSWGWFARHRRSPVEPIEIFEGVTYGCDLLEEDAEGSGLVHWIRVDLTAPGLELYVTPLDPEAVRQGWQYRLRRTGTVVREEKLAVGMNCTYFASNSSWFPRAGDLGRATETIVADHEVNKVGPDYCLLWFHDDLTPRMETSKPLSDWVLSQARWGIGCNFLSLVDGEIREGTERQPADSRTTLGIDLERKRLFMAVFENVSLRRAMQELTKLGARDGMVLDGGDSTSMALGHQARGVRPGVLLQGWRPPATHIGVRAKPIKTN